MPCFLVGESVAQAVSAVLFTRLFSFSHQQGHVAAALFSAGKLSWLSGEPFLAFHVSGGTTESLLVQPGGETIFKITRIGTSLDLKAGQLIDRVGVKLGLSFPAGAALDRLAMNCREEKRRAFRIKTARKGADVCLSGAENLCDRMIARGDSPEEVAAFCLLCVQGAIEGMLQAARERVGNLPVVFAGGVMCSRLLREHFGEDTKAAFAKASYSSDNAVGTAVLAGLSYQRLCVGQGA